MITLFESTTTDFANNGIGNLPDAISCIVTEERNGKFELEMEYPITGKRYSELSLRRIILAKPNPYDDPQPFRIYAITKPIGGIVVVDAEHISYDMSGYPVSPFDAVGAANAFSMLKSHSAVTCPFTFLTDITSMEDISVKVPTSMRAVLGSGDGMILSIYGGEYEFDRFSVNLWQNRGMNRGVSIRYGKNLTDLRQEENCSSVYTGVYPFWYSEEEGLVQLDEKYVSGEGTYNYVRILPLDLSSVFREKPTQETLRTEAMNYISSNGIGVPKVSLTVSFVPLSQSEEYRNYTLLEEVHLCDTVNVEFPELNVSATSKCICTKYNVITGKYDEIELGEARSNLVHTIVDQNKKIEEVPGKTMSFMDQAIDNATKLITGGYGGYVVLRSSTGGSKPDEILVMDTNDVLTAKKIWRWNKNGLGYSSNGYNGPFETAITADGKIVGSFLSANSIEANSLTTSCISAINSKLTLSAATVVETEVGSYETPTGVTYGFIKQADGYYKSSNAGIANSFSYGRWNFNFETETTVIIRAISYGEDRYDYGFISILDYDLPKTMHYPTSNFLHSFKNESSADAQEFVLTVPAGSHYITFKYVKNSSLDKYDDCFKIMCVIKHDAKSRITLGDGEVLISSAEISFDGLVKKSELNADISSYINGEEGSASITQAVSGKFVTPSQLSNTLNGYATTSDISGFVLASELEGKIETYISGTEGIGIITEQLSGTFVLEDELGDYSTKTEVSTAITQKISAFEASLTLSVTAPEIDVGSYETPSNVTYGFIKQADGYYQSSNAGITNSFSYGRWTFNFETETTVTIRAISYGESNFDYGIISILDYDLSKSSTATTSNILHSFYDESSANAQEITLSVPAGTHYITFKYIKDSSGDQFGDYFKIKCVIKNASTSTLTLKNGNTSITSVNITFEGLVTFADLSNENATTVINGSNIRTGKISAEYIDVGEISTKRVVFNYDGDEHNIISSSLVSENNAEISVGLKDYLTTNQFGQYLNLYGTQIYMIHTGYDLANGDSDNYSLKFDMANRKIVSGSTLWSIGYVDSENPSENNVEFGDACFSYIYAARLYCTGRLYMGAWGESYPSLRNYNGQLRWYNENGDYTILAE